MILDPSVAIAPRQCYMKASNMDSRRAETASMLEAISFSPYRTDIIRSRNPNSSSHHSSEALNIRVIVVGTALFLPRKVDDINV